MRNKKHQNLTFSKSSIYIRRIFLVNIVFILSMTTFVIHAENLDYLQQLEEEAQDSAEFNNGNNSSKINRAPQLKQFAKLLQSRRPATFRFFRQLSLQHKVQVLDVFQENQRLSSTRKLIFDLYFQEHK